MIERAPVVEEETVPSRVGDYNSDPGVKKAGLLEQTWHSVIYKVESIAKKLKINLKSTPKN